MKQIIDIETWERRDNYNFFRNFVSSWYSITTEIDCTEASLAARAAGRSFFLYYLYAVLRSANEVDELRFKVQSNDMSGNYLNCPAYFCIDEIGLIAEK